MLGGTSILSLSARLNDPEGIFIDEKDAYSRVLHGIEIKKKKGNIKKIGSY